MLISQSPDEGALALAELVRFSEKVAASETARVSRFPRVKRTKQPTTDQLSTEQSRSQSSYASPLKALRERDLQALAALFDGENGDRIETEIASYLLMLWPDPCWEEDAYDFLGEFL